VLLARHAAWTGDLRVFEELSPHVDAALGWIARAFDPDAGGYVAYRGASGKRLVNQGWKDSGDSIMNAEGTPARPPNALAEVHEYVWLAQRESAEVYEGAGERAGAETVRGDAEDLRKRFNRDFWSDDLQMYVVAVQEDGAPATVATSNAGQALWSGIAEPE